MERSRRRPARRGRRAPRPHPCAAQRGSRRPSLDHVAERILEERLPDCPRCGRPLEYRPGEASGSDRLECRECKVRYATTALMGDSAANELHGVYEELSNQFASAELPTLRPADVRYGHVVVDEAQDLSPMQWRGGRPTMPDTVVHPRRRRSAGSSRRLRPRRGTASSRRSTSRPTRCRATSSR